jgi:hypothetical protein
MAEQSRTTELALDRGLIKKGYASRTEVGAAAYTMDDVLSGQIVRTGVTGGAADTFPTAAAFIAAIDDYKQYDSVDVLVRHLGGANTITISANTGLTLSGTMTLVQNTMKWFKIVGTSVPGATAAATVYSITTQQAV